ncbi:MAG TPA: hypothetical protein VHC69_25690 [Polyangiaceae bacterium]|nr:hypothetical protein [Polyangiaceae bacterium]
MESGPEGGGCYGPGVLLVPKPLPLHPSNISAIYPHSLLSARLGPTNDSERVDRRVLLAEVAASISKVIELLERVGVDTSPYKTGVPRQNI